jgi:Uma2 family endonuclease
MHFNEEVMDMASVQPQTEAIEPLHPPAAIPGSAAQLPKEIAEERFLIRNIDWATYRKISDALIGRHYHMSYDGGDLELMTISMGHGAYSRLIVLMVYILVEEAGLPFESCGDMTLDREDLERGIQSDESFYITNAVRVQGKEKIDLSVDPPPDLGVEIDLTTDSRRRMGIYALIGVPEIWRYDGKIAAIFHRQADGIYALVEHSRYFPFLTGPALTRFIQLHVQMEKSALLRSFRQWVREQLGKKG